MLVSAFILVISYIISTKLKYSWEMIIIMTSTMTMLLPMFYPLTNFLFIPTKNLMLDSMSMIMLLLSMWIIPMMMMASYNQKMKPKMFMMNMSLMLFTLIMSFSSSNN